ncbi:MAG: hypothetical protein RIB65_01385 [Ilumatobacter fluminis]|uniref:hypothetical protein n=1 Tax=Ilumatobacter fluminis TaxID=467091 RepID=UPI0032EE9467
MSPGLRNDVAALADWWSGHSASLTEDVRGLWFGLFGRVGADGEPTHALYVTGAPSFEFGDGGNWACGSVCEPTDRYVQLDGLAAIDPADWQAALDHAVALVSAVEPWQSSPHGVVGVGVGFDDGDVAVVWTRRGSVLPAKA